MPNTLLIVSLLFFFGTVNGLPQRSPPSINADAKAVAELLGKTFTFVPKEEKIQQAQMCKIVKQCCLSKDYPKIFSISKANFSSDPIGHIGKICVNSAVRGNILKKCPSVFKLNASSSSSAPVFKTPPVIDAELMQLSMQVQEYNPAMTDFMSRMESTCNGNEHYATNCMTNKKLLQSCVAKALQAKFNSVDKKAYETYTKHVKGAFTAMNRLLEKTG